MRVGRALRVVSTLLALGAVGCGSSRPAMPPPGDPLDLVSAETLFRLGVELDTQGDSIRAEQYLSAALARGYPEAEVIPAIMGVCVRASRFGDALDYAEPYLIRHPDEWALRVLVVSIHMGLGQTTEAVRHISVVLDIAPNEPSGHYLMAVLARDSLDDPALARASFTRYLELAPDGERAAEARLELRRTDAGTLPGPTRLPPDELTEPVAIPTSAPSSSGVSAPPPPP